MKYLENSCHKSGVCEVSAAIKSGHVKYRGSPGTKYRGSCHKRRAYEVKPALPACGGIVKAQVTAFRVRDGERGSLHIPAFFGKIPDISC